MRARARICTHPLTSISISITTPYFRFLCQHMSIHSLSVLFCQTLLSLHHAYTPRTHTPELIMRQDMMTNNIANPHCKRNRDKAITVYQQHPRNRPRVAAVVARGCGAVLPRAAAAAAAAAARLDAAYVVFAVEEVEVDTVIHRVSILYLRMNKHVHVYVPAHASGMCMCM